MLNIRHNPGLIISGILYILILAIPMSFAVVQKFEEIELFVMTEDMPAPIKQMVQREKKIPEVRKETLREQKPVEEPQRVRGMVKAFMVIAKHDQCKPLDVGRRYLGGTHHHGRRITCGDTDSHIGHHYLEKQADDIAFMLKEITMSI